MGRTEPRKSQTREIVSFRCKMQYQLYMKEIKILETTEVLESNKARKLSETVKKKNQPENRKTKGAD